MTNQHLDRPLKCLIHSSATRSSPDIKPMVKTCAGPRRNVGCVVKLSVIVPFYNVQQYAPDTLRSLRANAREDFEFILVDDCSRDETPDILARAERELPGAVYVRHERNGGLATARNTGIDKARGEYLTFLARARSIHRVPHGRRGVVMNPREAILPADRSTSVDYAYAWAGVYHRRLVDKGLLHFTDGLRTAEDRPWIWKLHREADSFAAVGLLGVFYRRGVASSLTQVGDVRQLDFIRAFDQVIEETATDADADELLPKAVRTYCAIMAHHVGSIERFEPGVARQLRSLSSAALRRMPQDLLTEVMDSMDPQRSRRLRRLRRRPVSAGTVAA
jgi:hypothetical protein